MEVLEFYVLISRDSQKPQWVALNEKGDGRMLTDDFSDAEPFSTEEDARKAEREEEEEGDITYVLGLLTSS